MTLDEVTREIEGRGLMVVLLAEGQIALRGDKAQATPRLLAVLAWHREILLEQLAQKREREWILPKGTYRARSLRDDWHPPGAMSWRYAGETHWQSLEGVTV